jgi:hypothetical protein
MRLASHSSRAVLRFNFLGLLFYFLGEGGLKLINYLAHSASGEGSEIAHLQDRLINIHGQRLRGGGGGYT